jgi:formylglycine-generating enzyme required for sulfatase activity
MTARVVKLEAPRPADYRGTIEVAFYIGRTEVTQAEWETLMGADKNLSKTKGAHLPVENVSWEDAQKFIDRANQMNDGFRYSLPTEAQWEYACRAGSEAEDDAATLAARAWYIESPGPKQTHPPKEKEKNAFLLYDMQGNVREWCADWYHRNYDGLPEDGSARAGSKDDPRRVLRGGAYDSDAENCRCSFRESANSDTRSPNIGLRVVAQSDFSRVVQPASGR